MCLITQLELHGTKLHGMQLAWQLHLHDASVGLSSHFQIDLLPLALPPHHHSDSRRSTLPLVPLLVLSKDTAVQSDTTKNKVAWILLQHLIFKLCNISTIFICKLILFLFYYINLICCIFVRKHKRSRPSSGQICIRFIDTQSALSMQSCTTKATTTNKKRGLLNHEAIIVPRTKPFTTINNVELRCH